MQTQDHARARLNPKKPARCTDEQLDALYLLAQQCHQNNLHALHRWMRTRPWATAAMLCGVVSAWIGVLF